jgi:hypothetical protein
MSYVERPVVGDPYYDAAVYDEGEPNGWLVFAGLMIFFVGLWNAFEGFIGLFRSAYFTGTPVFGTLAFWSVVWIAFGILEMSAAYAIFAGRSWARWFGIILVGANALVHMLSIPLYPWWSIFIIVFNGLILYALAVRWHPRIETAAG